jgi:glycosyltransferase involved in cell wall biosynthesis
VSPDIYDESREEEIKNRYRAELGISSASKVVGMVASLTPRKGYHHLVNASAAVLKENPDTVFLGVGGGPQLDELEKQARELGVSDRFRFLGVRNDVRDLLCLFDIFTLASASEGLPYVILEAMCMKRAIVTTDVGGIPEALEHGRNGLLVKPGDVAQLADGINRLLADVDLADRIAAAARQTVINSFTVSRMVDKTEEMYRKLLA